MFSTEIEHKMSNNVKKSKKIEKKGLTNGNSDDILNLASEEAGFRFENFKSFLKEIKKSC